MADGELKDALQDTSEVELTVTGRKSGRESSRPVWFVQEADSNWYRNLLKTPALRLAADGAELRTTCKPLDDPAAVNEVVERFRGKYGADQVEQYYPKQDAAVEIALR